MRRVPEPSKAVDMRDRNRAQAGWTHARLISALQPNRASTKHAKVALGGLMWVAIFVTSAILVAPQDDGYGGHSGSEAAKYVLLTIAGLVLVMSGRRAVLAVSCRRAGRDVRVAHHWIQTAGPEVRLMILEGGPKIPAGTRVSTVGAHHALGAVGGGGAHPLITLGIGAFGLLAKGAIAASEAPERRRLQAELTELHRARAVGRLLVMQQADTDRLRKSTPDRPANRRKTRQLDAIGSSLAITTMALAELGE